MEDLRDVPVPDMAETLQREMLMLRGELAMLDKLCQPTASYNGTSPPDANGGGFTNRSMMETSGIVSGPHQQPDPVAVEFSWLLKEMHEKLETLGTLSEAIETKADGSVGMEHLDGAIMPLGYNAASPLHPDFTRLSELGTSELRFDSVHEQPPQDRGDVLLHHDPRTAFMHMRTCHQNGDRPLMDSPTSASDVVRDGTEDVKDRMKHEDPEDAPASVAEGGRQGEASEALVHLQSQLSAMSEAVELLANLEEMESASPRPHLPSLRDMECDSSTAARDASNVSIAESASPSISGSERVGLVRRVRGHLVSVSQQVGALAGKLEEGDVKNKVETLKGLRYTVTALFVVSLVAALMVLVTNYYVEASVGWNGTPLT